ncbi:VWD domain-containing protein [Dyadobacter sp. CY261]|uniref:VWD domain-containing protein n=1 Tax=Dyadobacter sp. CY261 TaxID=2907203 RepID=UPI001F464987|nr:VWD domain-containing protein [Dyadobacter sp. CY261]MCF0075580.1 VWD domain-containing protein [Dyadobacter sp. CY261]
MILSECKKASNLDPDPVTAEAYTSTLVIQAHNGLNQACILLIGLSTKIVDEKKQADLTGRIIYFSLNYNDNIESALNSATYDLDHGNLDGAESTISFFEKKLSKLQGYKESADLPQNSIRSFLNGETVQLANQPNQKHNSVEDIFFSIFSTPAYAQSPSDEVRKITIDIIRAGIGMAVGCFGGPSAGCSKSIQNMGKAVGNLWDFIGENIAKALNPQNPYSAENFQNDLANSSGNTSSGDNTQTNNSETKTGSGWGDPHISTFDGLFYDFQGFGEFTLTKSTTGKFEIQVRQQEVEPYSNGMVTLTTALAINTGSDIICILPKSIVINGIASSYSFSEKPLSNGVIAKVDNILSIRLPGQEALRVNLFDDSIDYKIVLNDSRKGKLKGLLGNFDGVASNDAVTNTGKSINPFAHSEMYPEFADSWRILQNESLFFYEAGKNTSSYTVLNYPREKPAIAYDRRQWAAGVCTANGVSGEPYFSACVMDVALSGDINVAKRAATAEESKSVITGFEINNFNDFAALDLVAYGDAKIKDGNLYLTEPLGWQASGIYKKYKMPINKGFELHFEFTINQLGGINDHIGKTGADGIALLFQDYGSRNIPFRTGGGMGYLDLPRSLAIEFDTFDNTPSLSEVTDGVWLNTKGVLPNSVNDASTLLKPITRVMPDYSDGKRHIVKVNYKAKGLEKYILEVFFDEDPKPYLTADNINIEEIIGGDNSGIYLGLTSATGLAYENHIIHKWSFKAID